MWTHFWDMHSGGPLKEKWQHIYIELPENEAAIVFYNRFGHNANRVSCTCCGEDYAIDSHEDLSQLTGFQRGCRHLKTPRDPNTGLYQNDDPVILAGLYLEKDQEAPHGYDVLDYMFGSDKYQTLEEYQQRDDVLFIYAKDISPDECRGKVPTQGYVWIDESEADK